MFNIIGIIELIIVRLSKNNLINLFQYFVISFIYSYIIQLCPSMASLSIQFTYYKVINFVLIVNLRWINECVYSFIYLPSVLQTAHFKPRFFCCQQKIWKCNRRHFMQQWDFGIRSSLFGILTGKRSYCAWAQCYVEKITDISRTPTDCGIIKSWVVSTRENVFFFFFFLKYWSNYRGV